MPVPFSFSDNTGGTALPYVNLHVSAGHAHGVAGDVVLARLALAPFTFTEATKLLEPIGMDRWAAEINLKYGIRNSMGCPIGGRWVFGFWSRKVIKIPQDQRALLYLGGAFATMRLQVLTEPFMERLPKGASLTARELSVLRLLAMGGSSSRGRRAS